MALTRSREGMVQYQQPRLRSQFQTMVVVLSCYYAVLLSPKLVVDLHASTSPAAEVEQQLSSLSVPSVISTDRQLATFFCRFLFYVYVACKPFVYFASCPAFRRTFLMLVTCSCCGLRHNDATLRSFAPNKRELHPPQDVTNPPH